jgi:hypothetical protein
VHDALGNRDVIGQAKVPVEVDMAGAQPRGEAERTVLIGGNTAPRSP